MHAPLDTFATWLMPVAAAIVMHDAAQASVARWLGGVSVEPARRIWGHIDPLGSVVVPLALAFAHAPIFGWGRRARVAESTSVRRAIAIAALTGPVACLINAIIAAMALGALVAMAGDTMPAAGASGLAAANLFNLVLANACMATFHLIPLPPFDVGRALAEFAPQGLRRQLRLGGRALALGIVAVVVAIPLLDPDSRISEGLAAPVINAITRFVLGLVNLSV